MARSLWFFYGERVLRFEYSYEVQDYSYSSG